MVQRVGNTDEGSLQRDDSPGCAEKGKEAVQQQQPRNPGGIPEVIRHKECNGRRCHLEKQEPELDVGEAITVGFEHGSCHRSTVPRSYVLPSRTVHASPRHRR